MVDKDRESAGAIARRGLGRAQSPKGCLSSKGCLHGWTTARLATHKTSAYGSTCHPVLVYDEKLPDYEMPNAIVKDADGKPDLVELFYMNGGEEMSKEGFYRIALP